MVTHIFTIHPEEFPVFDGSDPSLSFADFIRSIDVTLDMAHERADDVLPTFLYGDALRFYETLDQECHHDAEDDTVPE
ncbi:hypothetical protein FRC00_001083 [Tulasnella sp. 408]|nr:hypothetical protein FRC00_001083 [Tulasnella sp. 408]